MPRSFPKIPVRTELTVLSADDPNARTIGFSVYENLGSPVYKVPEGVNKHSKKAIKAAMTKDKVLRNLDDLQVGTELFVNGLWGVLAVCVESIGGETAFAAGSLFKYDRNHFLSGNDNPTPCWVCVGHYNTNGITKLQLDRSST